MSTCETCEFWKPLRDGYGHCEFIGSFGDAAVTDKASISVDSLGGEWDEAGLITRHDFGCTLHQEERP